MPFKYIPSPAAVVHLLVFCIVESGEHCFVQISYVCDGTDDVASHNHGERGCVVKCENEGEEQCGDGVRRCWLRICPGDR